MSPTQIEPPSTPRRRPAGTLRLSSDRETRSIQVGITATIILHLLLFLVAPYFFQSAVVGVQSTRRAPPTEFSVELEPEAKEAPVEEAPPFKFVEVNPNAPDNPPDKTANVGAQNQQVSQETPTPDGKSDSPAIAGQKEIKSTQIVDGRLVPPEMPQIPEQPVQQPPAMTQPAAAPRPQQNPLTGFEKLQGDAADSIGSNIATISENTKAIPEKIDGSPEVPPDTQGTLTMPIDRENPQPRQTVARPINTRPAVFEENLEGTAKVGPLQRDAKWSNYGQYLQRLIDSVQLRWEALISNSRLYPTRGSHVTITFILDKQGKIASIVSTNGDAGDDGKNWCVAAISPGLDFSYGPWTQDMIAILGDRQEMTFGFHYR